MRFNLIGTLLLCTAVLVACSDDEIAIEDMPPEDIYARAEAYLNEGNPFDAATDFSEVERLYPYSAWAKRAMIMSAYSYYGAADYEASQSAARRFIEFYPSDPDTAYARYLIALGYYDQIVDVGRDQDKTTSALQALREIVERHPEHRVRPRCGAEVRPRPRPPGGQGDGDRALLPQAGTQFCGHRSVQGRH
ncbi:MAG: outer membrane protein assembly factor BamD [Pseudomonadota bacterium]